MVTNKCFNIMVPNFNYFLKKHLYPYIDKAKPVTVNDPQQVFLPFYHAFGFATLLGNLYLGTSTISVAKFDLELICQIIQKYKVILFTQYILSYIHF